MLNNVLQCQTMLNNVVVTCGEPWHSVIPPQTFGDEWKLGILFAWGGLIILFAWEEMFLAWK